MTFWYSSYRQRLLCSLEGPGELSPFSGGYGEGETPLPIPNRAVKPLSADGTWPARAWESRTPPVLYAPGRPQRRPVCRGGGVEKRARGRRGVGHPSPERASEGEAQALRVPGRACSAFPPRRSASSEGRRKGVGETAWRSMVGTCCVSAAGAMSSRNAKARTHAAARRSIAGRWSVEIANICSEASRWCGRQNGSRRSVWLCRARPCAAWCKRSCTRRSWAAQRLPGRSWAVPGDCLGCPVALVPRRGDCPEMPAALVGRGGGAWLRPGRTRVKCWNFATTGAVRLSRKRTASRQPRRRAAGSQDGDGAGAITARRHAVRRRRFYSDR
jgi:hypothetical protein